MGTGTDGLGSSTVPAAGLPSPHEGLRRERRRHLRLQLLAGHHRRRQDRRRLRGRHGRPRAGRAEPSGRRERHLPDGRVAPHRRHLRRPGVAPLPRREPRHHPRPRREHPASLHQHPALRHRDLAADDRTPRAHGLLVHRVLLRRHRRGARLERRAHGGRHPCRQEPGAHLRHRPDRPLGPERGHWDHDGRLHHARRGRHPHERPDLDESGSCRSRTGPRSAPAWRSRRRRAPPATRPRRAPTPTATPSATPSPSRPTGPRRWSPASSTTCRPGATSAATRSPTRPTTAPTTRTPRRRRSP